MTDINLIPVPVQKAPADRRMPPHGARPISVDGCHEEAAHVGEEGLLELLKRIGADSMPSSTDDPHSEGVSGHAAGEARQIGGKAVHERGAERRKF
jgi:hypothetical protein